MKRQHPTDRQQQILDATMKIARLRGYTNVSREAISDAAGVSPALVSHYFGTMPKLKRAVIGEAIRLRDVIILVQGIANKDKRACGISDDLRAEVIASMTKN